MTQNFQEKFKVGITDIACKFSNIFSLWVDTSSEFSILEVPRNTDKKLERNLMIEFLGQENIEKSRILDFSTSKHLKMPRKTTLNIKDNTLNTIKNKLKSKIYS